MSIINVINQLVFQTLSYIERKWSTSLTRKSKLKKTKQHLKLQKEHIVGYIQASTVIKNKLNLISFWMETKQQMLLSERDTDCAPTCNSVAGVICKWTGNQIKSPLIWKQGPCYTLWKVSFMKCQSTIKYGWLNIRLQSPYALRMEHECCLNKTLNLEVAWESVLHLI